MGPGEVLRFIIYKLEQSDIQYMVTGSIAASYYGLARATYDLDIVISSTPEKLKDLISLLPKEEYYAVLQDAPGCLSVASPCSMFWIRLEDGKSILFLPEISALSLRKRLSTPQSGHV